MTKSKLRVESCDVQKKVIRITPTESFNVNQDASLLYQTITNLAKIKQIHLLLDLTHIAFPTTSFIAFLIEIASLLRRNGGDFFIVNLSETARINLITFNPFSFLRVLNSEKDIDLQPEQSVNPELPLSSANKTNYNSAKQEDKPHEEEFSIHELTELPAQDKNVQDTEDQVLKEIGFEELMSEVTAPTKKEKNERIVVHSREDQLYKLTDFVEVLAKQAGFDHTEVARIKISIYEAAHNIIEHAYQFEPDKFVELNIKYNEHKFVITLIDRGKSFDYDPNRNYDALAAAEERRTGGFGLFIIRRSMDDVKYETNPIWGNRLTLTKNIP